MISGLSGTYKQKLRALGLSTLEENRQRGDIVEMYKMTTGKSNDDFNKCFKLSHFRHGAGTTQGNS